MWASICLQKHLTEGGKSLVEKMLMLFKAYITTEFSGKYNWEKRKTKTLLS